MPSERKVHLTPMPRAGGIAVYLSFYLAFIPMLFLNTRILDFLYTDTRLIYVVAGGSLIFGVGVIDDIRGVKARTKLLVQILAALVVYMGGVQISALNLPTSDFMRLGWLSLPATVLWVLLVVNAVNLIDGLDGLASGVTFFATMVLIVLCVLNERLEVAVMLTALAGATLGFLRYNFNPASIFLGDSGSYFLGYMLAVLSMLGSVKGQAAVAILIPMIALGIPLMDTIWSSIRRFVLGQRIFKPDKDHFHHRLLRKGYSHRHAVMILYGFTIFMGVVSLFMVHARDNRSALLLLLVGAVIIFGIRKLGYLEYLAVDKLLGWMNDITDDMGIKRDRRTFLACQIDIANSKDISEFWKKVVHTANLLKLDYIEVRLGPRTVYTQPEQSFVWRSDKGEDIDFSSVDLQRTMYLSLPLEYRNYQFGTLVIAKNMSASYQFSAQILRRVEHLRRTVVSTIFTLSEKSGGCIPKPIDAHQQRLLPFKDLAEELHPFGRPADGYDVNGRPKEPSRTEKK